MLTLYCLCVYFNEKRMSFNYVIFVPLYKQRRIASGVDAKSIDSVQEEEQR